MLSRRLKAIADLVDSNKRLVDVGCDHALIGIYLLLNKKVTKVLAIDNNKNALKGAFLNVSKYEVSNIDIKLHQGLSDIVIDKTDTVIISGLGTNTIKDIITNSDYNNISTLIVQSNNDLCDLRKFICAKGFYVADEVVIEEKGIVYVIIKFKEGHRFYTPLDYYFGPIVRKTSDLYLNYLIRAKNKILREVPKKHIIIRLKSYLTILIIKYELKRKKQ